MVKKSINITIACCVTDAGKDKITETAANAVIDTKPVTSPERDTTTVIKPSKTLPKEKKASEHNKKVFSVVQVQSNPPAQGPTEKMEIKPSSKVNVIDGVSSVVSVVGKKDIISSKVEVVAASAVDVPPPPQQNIITKVEIVGGKVKSETPTIISSHVEVRGGSDSSVVTVSPVVSSIVNVKKEDEPAIVIGNNIGMFRLMLMSYHFLFIFFEEKKYTELSPKVWKTN